MNLDEQPVHCPYCGEPLTLLVDPSEAGSDYTEDCQVCCRPMLVSVDLDAHGDVALQLRAENE